MKNIVRRLKKDPVVIALILLVLAGTSVTFAYVINNISISNRFKMMTYDIQIDENFENKFGTKEVTFINKEKDSNTKVALRVRYNEIWSSENANGVLNVLSNKINNINVVDKNWTDAFLNDFVYDDGWYYYKKVLNSGDNVTILNSINKNSILQTHPEYDDYNYELTFSFEGIQATKRAIKDTWDKNITIEGDNITWGN